ncbi:MAG TPA: wax ester/triacylglycerol synthase family O-acyltransferase [Acidimicrobiales bacterium]|nr:wax ester/triacylglycerol synthase family O-acyltransferase [Acidimicrobiales bacterium]
MQRLSGIDAAFLAVETPTTHMHVASIVLLDPASAPGGWGHADVRRLVAGRLHLVPQFRRRVVEVPFGLEHPLWVEDPAFDLDHHLVRTALPAPCGDAELAELAGQVASRPLDRGRPLWEMHVVEGVGSGQAALIVKIHHAAIDGLLGAETLVQLLDLQPEPRVVAPEDPPWHPDPVPGVGELVAGALPSLAARPEALLEAARRTIDTVLAVRRRNEQAPASSPPLPFTAPRTSLNGPVTSRRRVAWAQVALDDVKAVKNAFGCTVNDVVLALCGAALRAHLGDGEEHPDADLVALVPVSVRNDDGLPTRANLLSPMLVSLATTIDDPVERLQAVAAGARRAKDQEREVGFDVVLDWAEVIVPGLASTAARWASRLRLADHLPPPCNLVVSNVPGPPVPLYLAGARVDAVFPIGPVADGVGLNITVVSYVGRMCFGLVADAAAAPALAGLAARLGPALEELVKAAATAAPVTPDGGGTGGALEGRC